jgi:LysR family transcriptional regulator, low CO2-responsive transcriptional regulator
MTLTQLNAFVMVARLGSVSAAASALGVSEPAVSQALSALRQQLGDQLISRSPGGMTLTAGGSRLLAIASQIVALGADAQAAVREAQGAPEQLRVVATSAIAEFVAGPLLDAFRARYPGRVEISTGVAATGEMPVLVANRLADVALGPDVASGPYHELISEPIFRCALIVVAARDLAGPTGPAGHSGGLPSRIGVAGNSGSPGTGVAAAGTAPPAGSVPARTSPRQWTWLVDPAGTDPGSEVTALLRRLGVSEDRVRVFANQTAAWAAAADGAGVAPAPAHLVTPRLRRGELSVVDLHLPPVDASWYVTMPRRDHRAPVVSALRSFLSTPEAMRLMRSPGAGVPPSRFRPPVHVTIWS